MKRTAFLVDEALLWELKTLAQEKGLSVSAIIREALTLHVQPRRAQRLSFLGVGASGKTNIAERHEQLSRRRSERRTEKTRSSF
jgi:hypothetical protein